MAKFAKTNPDLEIVQTISAQLSWSHNTTLLDKVKLDIIRIKNDVYKRHMKYTKNKEYF
jgi:hypothetical protein